MSRWQWKVGLKVAGKGLMVLSSAVNAVGFSQDVLSVLSLGLHAIEAAAGVTLAEMETGLRWVAGLFAV